MIIPTVPSLPAGYVVQLADMQNLAAAATFLLTRPIASARDTAGGVAVGTSATTVTFNAADINTDGMWASGQTDRLTIQTPGWYKVRYAVNISGAGSLTYFTHVISTTGANNPAGSGITSSPYWRGYADCLSGNAGRPAASGPWPFYLYAGDYIQVQATASAAGGSTAVGAPGGVGNGGSFFSLELVSI